MSIRLTIKRKHILKRNNSTKSDNIFDSINLRDIVITLVTFSKFMFYVNIM